MTVYTPPTPTPNTPTKPPVWAAHRTLTGADSATLPLNLPLTAGVAASNYRWGMCRFRLTGFTGATIRPLFWDEVVAKWVADPSIVNQAITPASAGMISFECLSRPFIIHVPSLTGSGSIVIEVAVFGEFLPRS
jgi:hypothetical protein